MVCYDNYLNTPEKNVTASKGSDSTDGTSQVIKYYYLKWHHTDDTIGTVGDGLKSQLQGSKQATSLVVLSPDAELYKIAD